MHSFEKLLLENKAWAAERVQDDPTFFKRLENIQKPEFLWIGCSDSRVPANEITNTLPGEIFVHRNIANLVVEDDVNCLSVLEYAVVHLKVKHVIVCGHYGCGGVKAAMMDQSFGIIDKWIVGIKELYNENREEIDALENETDRVNLLVEHNVRKQALNLAKTLTIQKTWAREERPTIHGWVYGLKDGLIKQVLTLAPPVKKLNYQIV
ncbi:MAG: carbonic anhydrase [Pseudobacter sp.]|uniref:carbonic anhydrase n=1 Tax=Pseudobacter sp. TaxID=2045420 RepID=UPI003F821A8F